MNSERGGEQAQRSSTDWGHDSLASVVQSRSANTLYAQPTTAKGSTRCETCIITRLQSRCFSLTLRRAVITDFEFGFIRQS
jgi:hypothetical protein